MIGYLQDVWQSTVDTWVFVGSSYWAGWLVALCLALPGVLVVARNQIFIGAAVAQSSTAGVALGFWAAGLAAGLAGPIDPCRDHSGSSSAQIFPHLCASIAAIIAALMCTPLGNSRRGSPESRTGWFFLTCSAFSVLLLSRSAHGSKEIERIIASNLLGVTAGEIIPLAILAGLSVGLVAFWRRQLTVLAIDPTMTPLANMSRWRWESLVAIWIGISTAFAIRSSGLLFSFGCLILPALAARAACREVRHQFWVAPLLGIIGTTIGFALATHHNLPPPQVAVLTLAALPILAAPLAWWHRR